jgi:S-adenosylmethionine:tRNA ribosyltransferase-isomerase
VREFERQPLTMKAERREGQPIDQALFPSRALTLADFDYDLPKHLIAQRPCPERDSARLMVVRRATQEIAHHQVRDLPHLLQAGDLLVLNDTRVLPARLYGRRERTGGKWEGLFLHHTAEGLWELLSQTRGRLAEGERIRIPRPDLLEAGLGGEDSLHIVLVSKTAEGHWLAKPDQPGPPEKLLQDYGHTPLPPYIRKGQDEPGDRERYQTVYAARPGAVAAPTAGLHFTPELLRQLGQRGVEQAYVTLHVGIGTFQPMQAENVAAHRMHREWGELSAPTAEMIRRCRSRGGRVAAVGTTSVRVLETAATAGPIQTWSGETDLFLYPPYQFRAVDVLLTNFHLPRSTLLVLVSAFAGVELVRRAYQAAVAEGYRFYSYGDAMLIL